MTVFLQSLAQFDQVLVVCAILAMMGLSVHCSVSGGRSAILTTSITAGALGIVGLTIYVLLM